MTTEAHLAAPEEIMALEDGELSAERAASVSLHLKECAECRELAETLAGGSLALREWTVPRVAPDAAFEQRLVAQEPARGQFPDVHALAAILGRRWAATAAVAAFVLAVGVSSSRREETRTPTAATAAKVSGAASKAPSSQVSFSLPVEALQPSQANGPILSGDRWDPADGLRAPLIARSVTLSVLVKDFGFSRTALDAILARHQGYAASLNANTQQNSARSLQASLRIPSGELGAAVVELKSLGQVENELQSGEEVTRQHADLVARLKNSRETEQRLETILLQRTGKISDVLAVEQEIARVRGETEQMEAEQKSLEHRVAFAAIDLGLAEEYQAQMGLPSPSISTRFHNATVGGYRSAVEAAVGVVLFFLGYGPSALLWLVVLAPLAWFARRRWARAVSLTSS